MTGGTPILPAAAAGIAEGPFRYPHDFEWSPRLDVSRVGTGRFQLVTSTATLKPGGRLQEARVNRLRGDDETGDGSAAKPFRTVARAWMMAPDGVDTVDIVVEADSLPPSRILWGKEGQCPQYATRLARPPSLILRASDGERLYIAACGMLQPADHYSAPPVWTPRGEWQGLVYTTPVEREASQLTMPYDLSPGALARNGGRPLAPRRAADAADVAARPGSALIDPAGGLLWFRPFDDRDMRDDPYVTKGSVGPNRAIGLNVSIGREAVGSKTVYLENVSVIGGSGGIRGINQSGERASVTVALKDVEAFGQAENAIQMAGGYDVYVVGGAYGGAAADALNVHAAGEHNAGIEVMQTRIFAFGVDATSLCGLAGDGRNNAATLHEWCLGAYFACRFAGSDGRVIGFIDHTRGVVAGCTIGGSAATDAGGFRTMVSASGAAVMDLVECTLLPQVPGLVSPSIRAEPGARIRLHGVSKAAIQAAGLTLVGSENIVEEDECCLIHGTAGPLRLYNRLVKRSGWTRLYLRGVWADAPWSAILLHSWNGTTVQGRDEAGRFVEVNISMLAERAPVLRLTHAPPGMRPWTFDVVLEAPLLPQESTLDC